MAAFVSRLGRVIIALTAMMVLAASVAEARVGGGRGSFGSRGARTWSAPPSTPTAPGSVAPIQRSQTPNQGPVLNRPPLSGPVAGPSRGLGFGTGLMAGLFGAGLLGMLMGNGFFGGLFGAASIVGLLLQIGLVVLLISIGMRWLRSRQQPGYAGPAAYNPHSENPRPATAGYMAGMGDFMKGAAARVRPTVRDEVGIGEGDYAAFERILSEMQAAYSNEDIHKIEALATPEMAAYLREEIAHNAERGVLNKVSNVRLLQGDLAEAWREGPSDYATVAMRYALTDVMVDRQTGQVVEGNPSEQSEALEVWTFRRDRGSQWTLSAIQQG